jgi:hypothetical protein
MMSTITKQTAVDIALAYQEVERSEKLLEQVHSALEKRKDVWAKGDTDLRDAFGRPARELQLGIPSGSGSTSLVGLTYDLAVPIIEVHIAHQKAKISSLSELAKAELATQPKT